MASLHSLFLFPLAILSENRNFTAPLFSSPFFPVVDRGFRVYFVVFYSPHPPYFHRRSSNHLASASICADRLVTSTTFSVLSSPVQFCFLFPPPQSRPVDVEASSLNSFSDVSHLFATCFRYTPPLLAVLSLFYPCSPYRRVSRRLFASSAGNFHFYLIPQQLSLSLSLCHPSPHIVK